MNYKIKCSASLGYSCCGMSHGDENYLSVELSDDEVREMYAHIDFDAESDDIMDQLEKHFPDIYEKITEALYGYLYFVAANDARESGLWQDCIQSDRDIEDFIQEDIDNGAIDNEDDEGNPLPDEEVRRLWYEHEDQYIGSLSFHDAYEYIIARYECEPDNIDGITYELEFPEEQPQE